MAASSAMRGVVHGRTIEVEGDLNLPEGQQVTVVVRPVLAAEEARRAIMESAGGWSDDPEGVDRFVEEVYRLREMDNRELPE